MGDSDAPTPGDAQAARARRARLQEIFGDVLPEQTGDDAADPEVATAEGRGGTHDAWLRRQVPPHHGG